MFFLSVSFLQMTADQLDPNYGNSSSPSPEDQMSEFRVSQGWAPCRGSRGGSSRLFQLPGSPGVRPWAGGRLPPVSASVSTWLRRCVRVSPLPCLTRTLSLGLGPPPPRRASSQTFTPSPLQRPCCHIRSSSHAGRPDVDVSLWKTSFSL